MPSRRSSIESRLTALDPWGDNEIKATGTKGISVIESSKPAASNDGTSDNGSIAGRKRSVPRPQHEQKADKSRDEKATDTDVSGRWRCQATYAAGLKSSAFVRESRVGGMRGSGRSDGSTSGGEETRTEPRHHDDDALRGDISDCAGSGRSGDESGPVSSAGAARSPERSVKDHRTTSEMEARGNSHEAALESAQLLSAVDGDPDKCDEVNSSSKSFEA